MEKKWCGRREKLFFPLVYTLFVSLWDNKIRLKVCKITDRNGKKFQIIEKVNQHMKWKKKPQDKESELKRSRYLNI